jgi:hypothetical protein
VPIRFWTSAISPTANTPTTNANSTATTPGHATQRPGQRHDAEQHSGYSEHAEDRCWRGADSGPAAGPPTSGNTSAPGGSGSGPNGRWT